MMKTINTPRNITFSSTDENGEFEIKIIKPKPGYGEMQLQLNARYDEAFCDVSSQELTAIRDMINTVLEETKQQE